MRAVVLTAGLISVMGLITGCSTQCDAVCSSANECTVDQRPVDVDCPEYCADVEDFNARAVAAGQPSCETQFQTHLDCWESNTAKVCDKNFEGCAESGDAFDRLHGAYCEAMASSGFKPDPNC